MAAAQTGEQTKTMNAAVARTLRLSLWLTLSHGNGLLFLFQLQKIGDVSQTERNQSGIRQGTAYTTSALRDAVRLAKKTVPTIPRPTQAKRGASCNPKQQNKTTVVRKPRDPSKAL